MATSLVTLVPRMFDGTERREQLPAPEAVALALFDPDNGYIYCSARIEGDAHAWPAGADWPPRQ